MARTSSKRAPKSSAQAAVKTDTATQASIPEPFTPVPVSLRPFVSTLPTSHVYALHVDSNPAALKRRVYIVPVLMNLAITAVLAWRVVDAFPQYMEQLITIFGYDTAWKVDPGEMSTSGIVNTISNRTFLLMFDYALFALLGSWPWTFAFGSKYDRHTGALEWRRKLGFKDTEIVVRKGRKWDEPLLVAKSADENRKWTLEDELTIKFKVEPAMRTSYTAKTGYLLLDKDWDLDFRAMIDAHRLVKAGTLSLKDVDHIVLVHYQGQWLVWNVHGSSDEADIAASTKEGDAVLRQFKDKLTALGCESIFFRWVEMIQYQTSLPGGFTQDKQTDALQDLKRQLTERSIDYDRFVEEIGGRKGVPGLTPSSR